MRGQPAKKGLSTKKSLSTEKSYFDGRGRSTENHHPEEKDPPVKKFISAGSDHQLERGHSVKRRLSTEKKGHPMGRVRPAEKSHLAGKGRSPEKTSTAVRDRPFKSCPAKESHLCKKGNFAKKGLFPGKDGCTRRLCLRKSYPAEEGYSFE